jgi:hypothetical protein
MTTEARTFGSRSFPKFRVGHGRTFATTTTQDGELGLELGTVPKPVAVQVDETVEVNHDGASENSDGRKAEAKGESIA